MASAPFVRYDWEGKISGVNEFQVAKSLLAGEIDILGQEIQDLDSNEHLFNLCMAYGLDDTARALVTHGVPGCLVQQKHLGPFAWFQNASAACRSCGRSWRTCEECCWGFDPESGCWMQDWAAGFRDVQECARKAAEKPLTQALFQALRSGSPLPGVELTDVAMARLLDIAILTGDEKMALSCIKRGQQRPLRRWRLDHFMNYEEDPPASLRRAAQEHEGSFGGRGESLCVSLAHLPS